MWWLNLLVAGLVGAAVIGIVVYGIITKTKIREQLSKHSETIRRVIVNVVDRNNNVVKLRDLDSSNTFEIKGNEISHDIQQNEVIVIGE